MLSLMITTLQKFVPLAVATFSLFSLTACPKGDVGAPCNHGDIDPPQSEVVTFPALSCNDLICVYADATEPPPVECNADSECNLAEDGINRFECVSGKCRLSATYTLERSMCSIRCESEADCQDGGIGEQVIASGTSCKNGFACEAIQAIPGEFCCQKLCVCKDDLSADLVTSIADACSDPNTCVSQEQQTQSTSNAP